MIDCITTEGTSNTAVDIYEKEDIEERLWQFIYSKDYEAECNSNLKQWLQDLCDLVEGKQFDKWKVLESMFLTYSKFNKLTE